MKKQLLWLLIGGIVYYAIEGVWRCMTGSGPPHVLMMVIGGVCFAAVGAINQIPAFYDRLSMRAQALIGAGIILAVELASGMIFNVWLGMELWDYAHMPLNLRGQICLLYGVLWLLLAPFAIWLEDRLSIIRHAYYVWRKRPKPRERLWDYTLFQAYKELVMFGEKRTGGGDGR